MLIKTKATIEDLYRVSENGKAEIVNGELRFMPPTGDLPGSAAWSGNRDSKHSSLTLAEPWSSGQLGLAHSPPEWMASEWRLATSDLSGHPSWVLMMRKRENGKRGKRATTLRGA